MQFLRIKCIGREHGNPNGNSHANFPISQNKGFPVGVLYRPRPRQHISRFIAISVYDRKFRTAQASDDKRFRAVLRQSLTELDQQHIPHNMPQCVINQFKVDHVNIEKTHYGAIFPRQFQGIFKNRTA